MTFQLLNLKKETNSIGKEEQLNEIGYKISPKII
jgi:hypothetical protein